MNKLLLSANSSKLGLIFPAINIKYICTRGYPDAGFVTNNDNTSQIGILITVMDVEGNPCIIHYASWRSRRVVRSPLAAESNALSACYVYCYALFQGLEKIVCQKVPIYLLTDSKSTYGYDNQTFKRIRKD